jgi:hypothetical protein
MSQYRGIIAKSYTPIILTEIRTKDVPDVKSNRYDVEKSKRLRIYDHDSSTVMTGGTVGWPEEYGGRLSCWRAASRAAWESLPDAVTRSGLAPACLLVVERGLAK